ncbi:thiosulfate:glutathione sulfurtransferase-like isoform X2 [Clupea harengus]|uniref:Thiosulfate:glutathione sulfurtransferase-like isoform X2 n=1 Tax=Clupea harengus TaxID=7950 RepID=A0A8M1K9M6_CLUHA|nr:thiosulfate:glutathione sulfurtransferase-like isoform X2 [Clupea harengus]
MTITVCLLLTLLIFTTQNGVNSKHEQGGEFCDAKPQSLCQGDSDLKTSSTVTYSELKHLLAERKVRLFDVRNTDEFAEGRIPTAVNVPLGELGEAFGLTPDQFRARYGAPLPPADAADVVLYCQRGRRSAQALEIIRGLGYHRARHYAGGYSQWSQ